MAWAGIRELLWLLELADDVASDLSVFHRIDEEEVPQMPSIRYVRLATRLGAYSGAVAARLRARTAERQARQDTEPPARPAPVAYRRGAPSMVWTRAVVPVEPVAG